MIYGDILNSPLTEKITREIEREFQKSNVKISTSQMEFHEILINFFNFHKKRIKSKPRKIEISNELNYKILNNKIENKYIKGFNLLKKKIKNGKDINSFLSSKILSPQYNDKLLNVFCIYHFHLGTIKKGKFIERTGFQAFAVVKESHVFFLDIIVHPLGIEYLKEDFLRIIKQNWPLLLENCRIKNISNILPITTEEERKKLRAENLNVMTQIDDNFYFSHPVSGLGIPLDVEFSKNNVIKLISRIHAENNDISKLKVNINNDNITITNGRKIYTTRAFSTFI